MKSRTNLGPRAAMVLSMVGAPLMVAESVLAQTRSDGPSMPPPPEHRPTTFPSPSPIVSPGRTPMPPSNGGTNPPIFTPPQIAPMEFKPWNSPPPVDRFNGNNGNGNAGNGGHGNHGGGNGNHGNTNDPDYLRRLRERLRLLSLMQNQWVIGPYGWIVYPDGSYFATSYYNDYRPVFQGVANSYDQTLAGQDSRAQNVPSGSGEPANDRDRGDRALVRGEVKIAIDAYRRHLLTDTTDATATRSLGVAMLISGNAADACAVVRRAYSLDPSLASQPFNLALLSPDGVSSTELVQRAVRDAQRNKSASAWLTAAVLAQSEGRETVALTMLDKARKEGLDSKIADRLAEAIEAHVASLAARRSVR